MVTAIDPAATRFTAWLKARSERRCVPAEFTRGDAAAFLGVPDDQAKSFVKSLTHPTRRLAEQVNRDKGGDEAIFRLTERALQ